MNARLQPLVNNELEFTGERMVPEKADPATFWEHIYRYRFATNYVRNKRVLDIACGEGYGTHALFQAGAVSIIGIEIASDVCKHAHDRYRLPISQGNAEHIPLQNHSVDVIVSFETIEHLSSPNQFLDECSRILAPGGTLIISTPNREAYHFNRADNPFHLNELNEAELYGLLKNRFRTWKVFVQRPITAKWWSWKSLIANQTPWNKVRGFWRAKKTLSNLLCSHINISQEQLAGYHAAGLINAHEPTFSFIANPYLVRSKSRNRSEIPCYFIVVAEV